MRLTKIGLQQPFFTFDGRSESTYRVVESIALQAETLGFDSFWLMDHMHQLPVVGPMDYPIMESWTTLSALAAKTHRIRLGTLVTNSGFRNPCVLAKMGASLDIISNGRLIMGIGAGNFEAEHASYDLPWLSTGQRIRRMGEAVEIVKMMWTQGKASFKGRHYDIKDAICSPPPVQKPHPPIMVGGMGEQLTLKIAARTAQMSNFTRGDPQTLGRKVQVLRKYCVEAGRDPDDILTSKLQSLIIGEDEQEVQSKMEKYRPSNLSPEDYRRGVIAGTPEHVASKLQEYLDAGLQYLIVSFRDAHHPSTLRLFMEQVASRLS